MTVRIGDVIQPEIFTPYVIKKTMEKSELVQSGIIANDPQFDELASGPNTLVNMPFWEDLDGESETMQDDGALTPGKIGSNKDVARKHGRARAWGANGLSALLSGDDPMGTIAERVADYWVRDTQRVLLHTLRGVFAAGNMSGHVHDISDHEDDAALVTGSGFVDATQKLGDAKDRLTGVMMHSIVEAYLIKRQLIEYVEQTNELGMTISIPHFMGKRVIVDDAMPYDVTGKVAEMYLFGQGAVAMGNGHHPNIIETEVDRDSLASSGEDFLINRRIYLLHPRGIKWTESDVAKEFPTNNELAEGQNWSRVFDKKDIRVVKFKFKISD